MITRTLWSILAILMLSVSLIACGGNSDQESSSADETGTADSQQQTITQAQSQPETKLNLNTASEDEFLTIPGVGESMVHEFEEYRPYISIQQFRREIGKYVDDEQVAAYEQFVYVPIAPNDCDAATLQQIPGLDDSEAQQLVDARPFDSHDAFLQQLSEFVNEEQLATAESYLVSE